jgi:uncharacterized membrane protein
MKRFYAVILLVLLAGGMCTPQTSNAKTNDLEAVIWGVGTGLVAKVLVTGPIYKKFENETLAGLTGLLVGGLIIGMNDAERKALQLLVGILTVCGCLMLEEKDNNNKK